MLLFLLPLIAVALIIIPLAVAVRKQKLGLYINRKKTVLLNAGTFVGTMLLMTIFMPVLASAEGSEAVAAAGTTIGDGIKALAAALSTGMATIGTGIAVGMPQQPLSVLQAKMKRTSQSLLSS